MNAFVTRENMPVKSFAFYNSVIVYLTENNKILIVGTTDEYPKFNPENTPELVILAENYQDHQNLSYNELQEIRYEYNKLFTVTDVPEVSNRTQFLQLLTQLESDYLPGLFDDDITYKTFLLEKAVKANNNQCGLCGWQPGNGTKICYSDPETGDIKHLD